MRHVVGDGTGGGKLSAVSGPAAIGVPTLAMLLAFTYITLLGGTNVSELSPWFALVSVALAVPFVAVYVVSAPVVADRTDRLILVAVLLFLAAGLLSSIPRLSFEPALAALAYAAALFVARGLLSTPQRRAAFMWTLISLSIVMTAITAMRWGAFLIEWLNISGWRAVPPLNMELPSFPWGHRHDLALLVTMLYPAWWLGQPSMARRVLAVVVGGIAALVVVVDGSRMLWLAMLAASIALGVQLAARWGSGSPRLSRRSGVVLLLAGIGLVGLLAITGAAGAILQRVANFESVGWRTAMWSSLVESWLTHPLAGSGPGTFAWVLQGTGYFDTTSFAPRHPDSAPIQLLAEGGLLGLAGLAVVLIVLVPGLVANRQRASVWSLTAFAVASLGSNPTDFSFMVLLAVAWTAYGLPRTDARAHVNASSRLLTGARVGAMGVVGVAWLLTWFGAQAYAGAHDAVTRGDDAAAADALDVAIALDPGMPLYVRERGTLRYAMSDWRAAAADLRRATAMNPSDDVAWRTLAAAEAASANGSDAALALDRALQIQRSDPVNLLLRARAALEGGDADVARATLAEVVQAWPSIVFAPEWDASIREAPFGTDEIVADAARRWNLELHAPEMVDDQGLWLLGMSEITGDTERALAESGYGMIMADAMALLLRCEPATTLLSDPSVRDIQSTIHWQLRLRDAAVTSTPDPAAERMVEWLPRQRLVLDPLNPLQDESVRGTSADVWGYRRAGIAWPEVDRPLPSPRAGLAAWLTGSDCDR